MYRRNNIQPWIFNFPHTFLHSLFYFNKASKDFHSAFIYPFFFLFIHIYKTSRRMFKQEQTGALSIFVGIFFQRSLSLSLLSPSLSHEIFFLSFFYIKISTLVQEFNFAWDEIHRASDLYH